MMHKKTWSDYSSYFSANHLIAGFTNQYYPYSSVIDRVEFAKMLKLDSRKIVIPQQIHSSNVTICTKAGNIIDTDGIVTNNKDLILSIQVADCIPIYIYDYRNQNIALVHAGWRGVNLGIIENSIKRMKELDSNSIDIKVLLGPSIRQCCFEVGPEVGKLFDNKFQENGKGNRTQLDLQGVVIDKLFNMNIQNENIIDIKECTCCSDRYHSYRRDGDKAGRMIAMIGWV
ncbi:peptidoglycan editing factor PgeF [bacterium]|nr:peptidoglycan editing factor PgeF [bacterium]